MENLQQTMSKEVNGENVKYGEIPSGLINGWEGIVYFFKTSFLHCAEAHEKAVKPLIDKLVAQNDKSHHGVRWEKTKIEAVVWERNCQITLVSFRVRDSY